MVVQIKEEGELLENTTENFEFIEVGEINLNIYSSFWPIIQQKLSLRSWI